MITLPTYQGILSQRKPYYNPYEVSSQAFFAATGISDDSVKNAVNQLVIDLKTNSLWAKGKLINPIAGGSAATHKFNLKDPQDTDAAYRLNFLGTITHSSNGMLPNGSTGYANTFLNPNTVFPSTGLMSIGIYSRTNTLGNKDDIGATSSSSYTRISPNKGYNFYGQVNSTNCCAETTASSDLSAGWYFASRSGATASFIQKNNTRTLFTPSRTVTNNNLFVMANNNLGTAGSFSDRQLAFVWVGDALTATEASSLYTIIQTYQTSLGRNV
ncbi:MAG: hypothetical protein EOO46_01400 [Flavobacterium sp.]|nr:MAG: hypothetical protein EOO46_01400 [Flavobacterium sp.]